MGEGQFLSTLKLTEKNASFNARLGTERRSLDFTGLPYEKFIGFAHAIIYAIYDIKSSRPAVKPHNPPMQRTKGWTGVASARRPVLSCAA